MYNNITVERLQEIEDQRNETYANPAFQSWIKTLNVSGSWQDKEYIINAREAMRDWDTSRFVLNIKDAGYIDV
jgi:hypothetical protein